MTAQLVILCTQAPTPCFGHLKPFKSRSLIVCSGSVRSRSPFLETSHDLAVQPPQQLQWPHKHAPLSRALRLSGSVVLGSLWLLGHPSPAAAGVVRPSPQLETVVTIAPQAGVTPVTSENDSCAMLVAVCLGFWMLSATISAAIGAVMKLTGRSMAYASSSSAGAGWTSAGAMDMLDIMQLPLAYDEEPLGSGIKSATGTDKVTYLPWEGPDTYIPVSMVKVFQPGLSEAGRVARPSLLQGDQALSIVSVTRPADANITSRLPTNGNSNGSKNGKSSSNGSDGSTGSNVRERANEE